MFSWLVEYFRKRALRAIVVPALRQFWDTYSKQQLDQVVGEVEAAISGAIRNFLSNCEIWRANASNSATLSVVPIPLDELWPALEDRVINILVNTPERNILASNMKDDQISSLVKTIGKLLLRWYFKSTLIRDNLYSVNGAGNSWVCLDYRALQLQLPPSSRAQSVEVALFAKHSIKSIGIRASSKDDKDVIDYRKQVEREVQQALRSHVPKWDSSSIPNWPC